ncbi:hypothetical protein H2198_010081 [Neophaeococcomyces mojaviensis]|uniref:Uncharacterized protein n=1 Tax=Neophaeococcomyces mojaviensis TaxID=3383035 RepID=A0ACC2ZSL1_9EURO|nr:hypothetical protein H2198_010081 [Knufia sp. JES_112]
MKRWVTDQKGISHLRQEEAATPTAADLKDGEVLVKIYAVSLNYRDTEVCSGTYGHHDSVSDPEPFVPCSDMCGTIVESKSVGLPPGTRVISTFNQTHLTGQCTEQDLASGLGLPLPGVLAEFRIFPDYGLVKVPDHLSDIEASTLPIAAVTAWMALNTFQPVGYPIAGSDKTVLLQGTGGVAIAGLQIAKALGLTAIITSSSDSKLQRAKVLGADHGINYRSTSAWDKRVLELTGGKGADIIFETGGAETLWKSFECVAFGGVISAIGYLSGKEDSPEKRWNVNVMALKRTVTLKGILNGPRERFEEMLQAVYTKEKGLKPVVDRVFEFDEAKEALQYLESGKHFGKVVIKVT